jgi:hypothetical protein
VSGSLAGVVRRKILSVRKIAQTTGRQLVAPQISPPDHRHRQPADLEIDVITPRAVELDPAAMA